METTIVGRSVAELDTPVLLVDLPALKQYIGTMAGAIRERDVAWRLHGKEHKTPAIAH